MAENEREWAEKWGLTPETLSVLCGAGLESRTALSLLTPSIINGELSMLSLGQRLLLKEAVRDFQGCNDENGCCDDNRRCDNNRRAEDNCHRDDNDQSSNDIFDAQRGAPTTGDGANILDTIRRAAATVPGPFPSPTTDHTTNAGMFTFMNQPPRDKVTHGKAKEVRDFIALAPEKPQAIHMGGVQIKVNDGRVAHDKLSVAQYFEGALKILIDAIDNDNVDITEVRQQAAYLTKVATFAQVFEWPSVLNFDTAFRRDRHAANKNWETDNNFLMQAYLRQKSSGNEARTAASLSGNSRAGDKTDPRTGKPICKRFNSQKGCGLRVCNFTHACSTCLSTNHGETRHVTKNE
ncbi:hypothetical protein BaRGS_00026767 [Batillaria attramentaria]|uniref:C3H1-type domain-containing protein n=1 Tax=Batillaria attramentaria TaxID=370345 RepID=A0ABD0K4H2_9CAEN